MAVHQKKALLGLLESSLRISGLGFLKLSPDGVHPAIYQISGSASPYRLRVYMWNLTLGGRNRPSDEWRIQVTGLANLGGGQRIIPEVGGKTLLLGWGEEFGVFAGFDAGRHLGILGGSPSVQIRQRALEAGHVNGLSYHFKGDGEVAFAVKPSCMGSYIENLEDLHACGTSNEALELLERIFFNPDSVDVGEIERHVPAKRRFGIVSARKALREANFKERVLTAYSNACAMCGIQMRLLDAAHILPAAHPDSTDQTSNGIALCALHHRAFDLGLVTLDPDYRVCRNDILERELIKAGLDGGIDEFRSKLFSMIAIPPDRRDWPDRRFIVQVNSLRGWKF